MAKNPNGLQFQTLSTHFKGQKPPPKSTPSSQRTQPNGSARLDSGAGRPKTQEEQEAENDLGSYANLIYGTIKNFFSGIIEIKGGLTRRQNHF